MAAFMDAYVEDGSLCAIDGIAVMQKKNRRARITVRWAGFCSVTVNLLQSCDRFEIQEPLIFSFYVTGM